MSEHKEVFALDSGALIDIHNHLPSHFRSLRRLVQGGYVKILEGVFRELRRKTDKLFKIIEKWKNWNSNFIVQISHVHKLQSELARIEREYGEKIPLEKNDYPGFWKSPSGKKAADGQVIAVAKVLECKVVSDDLAVRLACMLEGIACIGWTEFVRQMGLIHTQLELF